MERGTVAVVGVGGVGAAVANALARDATARHVTLCDLDQDRAQGEALDLMDAVALGSPVQIEAGDFAQAARAELVVLCAGKGQAKGQTRLDLLEGSARVVRECVGGLREAGFAGVMLVVSNPADVMAALAVREGGLPPGRVIGSGTLLDSIRLRRVLGARLGVEPRSVRALVVGEHGDSSVSLLSSALVGGVPLAQVARLDRNEVQAEVRGAAKAIIAGKGFTGYGIASCVNRIVRAVMRDERSVVPVATVLDGPYGLRDVVLSTPCVLGRNGVEQAWEAAHDAGEREAVHRSAEILREAGRQIGL